MFWEFIRWIAAVRKWMKRRINIFEGWWSACASRQELLFVLCFIFSSSVHLLYTQTWWLLLDGGGTIINAFIDSIKNEELLERDLQADKWRERVKKNEGRMMLFVMIYKYDSFFKVCSFVLLAILMEVEKCNFLLSSEGNNFAIKQRNIFGKINWSPLLFCWPNRLENETLL